MKCGVGPWITSICLFFATQPHFSGIDTQSWLVDRLVTHVANTDTYPTLLHTQQRIAVVQFVTWCWFVASKTSLCPFSPLFLNSPVPSPEVTSWPPQQAICPHRCMHRTFSDTREDKGTVLHQCLHGQAIKGWTSNSWAWVFFGFELALISPLNQFWNRITRLQWTKILDTPVFVWPKLLCNPYSILHNSTRMAFWISHAGISIFCTWALESSRFLSSAQKSDQSHPTMRPAMHGCLPPRQADGVSQLLPPLVASFVCWNLTLLIFLSLTQASRQSQGHQSTPGLPVALRGMQPATDGGESTSAATFWVFCLLEPNLTLLIFLLLT